MVGPDLERILAVARLVELKGTMVRTVVRYARSIAHDIELLERVLLSLLVGVYASRSYCSLRREGKEKAKAAKEAEKEEEQAKE